MKVLVDGRELRAPRLGQWTFREEQLVARLTGLHAGDILELVLAGSANAQLGFAIVAYHRAGLDPEAPVKLQEPFVDDVSGDTVSEVSSLAEMPLGLIFSDVFGRLEEDVEGDDGGPPAGGAPAAKKTGKSSRRKT